MIILDNTTLIACRTALLQCREFQSYSSLRAVFVTDHLSPFKFRLPSGESPSDLVDRCLEYLSDVRLRDGRPALPVFLLTLRDRYELGDALRDDLQALCDTVEAAATAQAPSQQVPPSIVGPKLFDKIMLLDFRAQVRMVKQVIDRHRVAAFLVHGDPDCGQQVLVNRLVRLSPGWSTGQRICIDAGSNGIGKTSYSLWRQIAAKLSLPAGTHPRQLAEQVCEWWKTQDVIFVFHTVDYMPPVLLSAWLREFWQPLASMANQRGHLTDLNTHLMMFLVDYSGHVSRSGVPLADRLDDPAYPLAPLCLPPTSRFPFDELDFWLTAAAEVLPAEVTGEALLAASDQGIPLLVYDIVCERCGLSWEGELARWLI